MSTWYDVGYANSYNWRMKRLGGLLISSPEEPTAPKTREDLSDYIVGQVNGEIDAGTIFWAYEELK